MTTAFTDIKPFPGANGPSQSGGFGHNRPPLEEQVVLDFEDALVAEGLKKRIDDLVSGAGRAGDCTNDDTAGKFADVIRMIGAAGKAVEAEREKLNRPILTAQRALKGRSDSYLAQLTDASTPLRKKLDTYMAEQRRIADEQRRQAEAKARAEAEAARKAAEAEGVTDPVPAPAPEPVKVEAPVVHGDMGSRVGSTTVWLHEVESVRKLPDSILKHEKVLEAINKVVGAMVRGGTREMKGVRIYSEQRTAIR